MEASRKAGRARKVAPVADPVEATGVGAEAGGADRDGGAADRGARAEPFAKTWAEIQARLSEIERPNIPVCAVFMPNPPRAVWMGAFGGAKLYEGDGYAVLSTGEKVRL